MCEGAKFRMIEAALEKASLSKIELIRNSGQYALDILHEPSKERVEDDTTRLPKK